MKKIIFALVFVAGATGVFAQSSVRYGLKAGYVFSDAFVSPEPGNFVRGKSGLQLGIFAEIPAGTKLTIQPELNYTQQGFHIAGGVGQVGLHYLQVPVLAKLHFTENVSVVLGPQVGYLADARVGVLRNLLSVSYTGAFQKADVSGVAGVEINTGKFLIGGRYNHGLNNINKDFNVGESLQLNDVFRLRNSAVQLSVGYRF